MELFQFWYRCVGLQSSYTINKFKSKNKNMYVIQANSL